MVEVIYCDNVARLSKMLTENTQMEVAVWSSHWQTGLVEWWKKIPYEWILRMRIQ